MWSYELNLDAVSDIVYNIVPLWNKKYKHIFFLYAVASLVGEISVIIE